MQAMPPPRLSPQLPAAPDREIVIAERLPRLSPQLPAAPDREIVIAERLPRLSPQLPAAPDSQWLRKELLFTGAWLPAIDPLLIGEQNYADLQNFRYTDRSLRLVQGYSKITTNALTGFLKGRAGIQFIKRINGTEVNHTLVQAWNTGLTDAAVRINRTAIPSVGDYDAASLFTDDTAGGLGRWSLAPGQQVAYCNGRDSAIWGSEEHRVSAFIVGTAASAFRRDGTAQVWDLLTGAGYEAVVYIDAGSTPDIFIGSTRPLKAFKFYMGTVNAVGALTSTVNYWGAVGWTAVVGLTDGTIAGGTTLAQTGSMSFDSTVTTARIRVEDDLALYFYRIRLSGVPTAGTSVAHCTVDAPFQSIKDTWDGVPRRPISFQRFDTGVGHTDYTLEVNEESSAQAPIVAVLDGLDSPAGDAIHIGFSERVLAVTWKLSGTNVNTVAATVTVSYWNGVAWVGLTQVTDGTLNGAGTVSLNQTGTTSWLYPAPPPAAAPVEERFSGFGVKAYFYRFTWSAALAATVRVDSIEGIPAPRLMGGFRFPFHFQRRLFLMGSVLGHDGNLAEYSLPNVPDCWNGRDTSGSGKQIRFGQTGTLSAAVELYNRFAGTLTYMGVVCTLTETFILIGNDPGTFQILPISHTIGCPAPLTLDSMEVAFSVEQDAERQIAMWLSMSGPVMFDGGVLVPIPGLEPYFDPLDARYIVTASIENARGWFDPQRAEYHLEIPSGSGQTLNDEHFVYDLRRKKWFRIVSPDFPQCVFPVRDAQGRVYIYGTFEDGHLRRLENGATFDGTAITGRIDTADVVPSQSAWDVTRLRFFKLIAKRSTAALNAVVSHFADSATASSAVGTFALNTGTSRYRKVNAAVNLLGLSHQLRIEVASSASEIIDLFGVGGLYEVVRDDLT